ncbi:Transcription factor grauzone [Pseudolycoriella hygida]|uniref:Transcription factor grauzone n=1 Tax=Pseudolycoriella hygida TaxID=35572 RepID=A0A9Q0N138_9DIPT|nr:Transcription factor grauzone [Pseudolycoriella hygida]
MDSNSTWLCRLCCKQSKDLVNIFDKFQNVTIASILSQHFWFQISKDDGLSDSLCQNCWANTRVFHIFYTEIELLQKEYLDSVQLVETNFFCDQIKREPSPTNPELEIDLNLVKSEEESKDPVVILEVNEEEIYNFNGTQSEILPKLSTDSDGDQSRKTKRKRNSPVERIKTLKSEKNPKSSDPKQSSKTDEEDAQIREYFTMSCEICSSPFKTYHNAKRHYRVVHKIRGYLICSCGRKFIRRGGVLSHISFHLNPDEFRCNQCDKRFSDKSTLKTHIRNHEPISSRAFKCDLCPRSFTIKCRLLSHQQFVHCPVKCDECGMSYPSKSKLTTHIRNVHQPKVYTTRVCDICGKNFVNKNSLRTHVLAKHSTIEKPKFQCDICGVWLKHKSILGEHMEKHRGGTAQCSICDKVLQNKFCLANHIRYVHTEKSHQCSICNKSFRTPLILKEHIAGHTGQDLYECAYCTKTFKSSANMYSHRKKMHLAEWTQDCRKRSAILEKITVTKDDGFSDCLCQICWTNTRLFHVFYEEVEMLQRNFWNTVVSVDIDLGSDSIKEERSGTPTNAELKLDLNVVKSEEIQQKPSWLSLEMTDERISNQSEHPASDTLTENEKVEVTNRKQAKSSIKATTEVKMKKIPKSTQKQRSAKSQSQTENEDSQIREFFRMACEICGHPFETFRKATNHYREAHNTQGYLICCGRKYTRRGCALRHIQYHLDPNLFRCDQCGKQFSDERFLKAHIENHEPLNLRAFKCDLCPKSFTREFKLISHKEFVHCPVQCDDCGMSFLSRSKLSTHIKNAHQPKVETTRICDICGKSFANKYVIETHMKAKHSASETPKFQCDICGAWIKHKAKLKIHMERHLKEKATCPICSKVLINKFSLEDHIRRIHTEKKHRCTICNKTLRTHLSLKEHMALHTGKDLYKCSYCTKTFKSSSNMYSHRKKKHFAEWTQDRLGVSYETED